MLLHGKYPAGFLCKSECKLKLHLGYFFLMGETGRQRTAVNDNFVGTSSLSTVSVARRSQAGIGIKRLQRLSCKETSINRARQICNENRESLLTQGFGTMGEHLAQVDFLSHSQVSFEVGFLLQLHSASEKSRLFPFAHRECTRICICAHTHLCIPMYICWY